MADEYGPYVGRVGGRSPSSGGFSRQGGGRWIEKRIIGDKGDGLNPITSLTDLYNRIEEILGSVKPHPDGYRLQRKLPKAIPEFPWLAADRISDMVGIGQFTMTETPGVAGDLVPFDYFPLYRAYDLTIEFVPRAFAYANDEAIGTDSLTWTQPDGDAPTKTYAKEWLRYTTFSRTPAAEWITAEAGQFQFDVASGEDPDGFNASKGQIKMLIPQNAVQVLWQEVPSDYVDSTTVESYIQQGLGHINQIAWRGFPAGTLLFTAVNVNRYLPPIPEYGFVDGSTILAPKQNCDITFIFVHRDPELGDDAAGNPATPDAAATANIIQAGHNYMPLAHTGSWYFAKTTGVSGLTDANNRGAFPSFPFELLFTNPGV